MDIDICLVVDGQERRARVDTRTTLLDLLRERINPRTARASGIEAPWIDEHDPHVNAMGSTGTGEIGIVGTAAAVADAAFHATGVRVRDLPVTVDTLLA